MRFTEDIKQKVEIYLEEMRQRGNKRTILPSKAAAAAAAAAESRGSSSAARGEGQRPALPRPMHQDLDAAAWPRVRLRALDRSGAQGGGAELASAARCRPG